MLLSNGKIWLACIIFSCLQVQDTSSWFNCFLLSRFWQDSTVSVLYWLHIVDLQWCLSYGDVLINVHWLWRCEIQHLLILWAMIEYVIEVQYLHKFCFEFSCLLPVIYLFWITINYWFLRRLLSIVPPSMVSKSFPRRSTWAEIVKL